MTSDAFVEMDESTESGAMEVATLIAEAARSGASDLLILADDGKTTISVRRWGRLEKVGEVDTAIGRQYIGAVKVMAQMDIAERRRPLDGRMSLQIDGRGVDIRVNTLPTLYGEDATLRLLDPQQQVRVLDDLGLSAVDQASIDDLLGNPSGLILVTGPTGAGKTTTLYACLAELNDGARKINTLEDPIEYALAGIRQSQVNPAIGLDFAQLLASVLRQAPDVVMVGEVRDEETAATAVRAANSGHLVFATLHAPTASGAVQSMLALGVAPHFLASSLIGVIAQRLVRRLCAACCESYELPISAASPEPSSPNGLALPREIFGPRGCHRCEDVGYVGREGVFEILTATSDVRALVAARRPRDEIHRAAIEAGMVDFRTAALQAVAEGRTTIDEVVRVIPMDVLGVEV